MSRSTFSDVVTGPENQLHHRNVKQFGASEKPRPSAKKTALTDVKNILSQRSVGLQSTKKLQTSANKPSVSKKNLFGVYHNKENLHNKKDEKKHFEMSQAMSDLPCSGQVLFSGDYDLGSIQPACSFCDKNEDDCADILLQSLTLTKNEINKLALDWERKPVVGIENMRQPEISAAVPNEMLSYTNYPGISCDMNDPELLLLHDIPFVESISCFEDLEE